MLESYTWRLTQATLLLHTIYEDKERLDLVLELQRFLIRRITAAEGRVRRLKALVPLERSGCLQFHARRETRRSRSRTISRGASGPSPSSVT